jgi:hypothetical protein
MVASMIAASSPGGTWVVKSGVRRPVETHHDLHSCGLGNDRCVCLRRTSSSEKRPG